MSVCHVMEFIESLAAMSENLSEMDREFLKAFQERYSIYLTTESRKRALDLGFDEGELSWIQAIFAERWEKIADDFDEDYTFDPGGVNAPWFAFAKYLAGPLKKPYILILIPVIANNIDPNNFSRLKELPDPRSLYLSNDHTWHRVLALYEQLKKTGIFAILDNPKSKPRALTLDELRRIRCKRGEELAFSSENGTRYSSFWDYVIRESAPTWREKGCLPTHLLPTLLEMIENYFSIEESSSASVEGFRRQFKYFTQYLNSCSLDEVNYLYGLTIQVNDKNYFLVEILLDCMMAKDDLRDKLLAVAKWLCRYDPSLISTSKSLAPIYQELRIGPCFDLSHLNELTSALVVKSSSVLKSSYEDLLGYLNSVIGTKEEMLPETRAKIVEKIWILYRARWERVIDTSLDYLRLQNGENHLWIRLAQCLAGAGYIDANYYKLLITTLKQDYEPVTGQVLTTSPLSHYILSTSGTHLIHLDSCIEHHKARATFYNCNYKEPRPLSSIELKRLEYADAKFYRYYLLHCLDESIDDPPISKATIKAVLKLVNGTLNPSGLSESTIADHLQLVAEQSYEEFLGFLVDLPEEEQNSLFKQRILWRSERKTFAELMDLVQANMEDDRICIAVLAQFMAKMVIDYMPWIEIDQKVKALKNMRLCSACKVPSDYAHIDDKEAARKVLSIMVSLFTHQFSCMWLRGRTINIGPYSNKVTDTGYEIFKIPMEAIERNDFGKMRFIYFSLMESIIIPATSSESWARSEDTTVWLESIKNGSLLKKSKSVYFDPEVLLIVFWDMVQRKIQPRVLIESFLDEMLKILTQSKNSYKNWIKINIEFTGFLNNSKLSEGKRSEILRNLRTTRDNTPISPQLVQQSCIGLLIHRLAKIGTETPYCSKRQGLFGIVPGQSKERYNYFKEGFERELEFLMSTEGNKAYSIGYIITQLKKVIVESKKKGSKNMRDYLSEILPDEKLKNTEELAAAASI